jgi:hypothetical protein
MKRLIWPILLLLAFFAGIWVYHSYTNSTVETNASDVTVLYEEIKTVCKLIAVEATYSERFDSLNEKSVSIFYPLPYKYKLSKTATIFVSGKMMVGYDMSKMSINMDSETKTVTLSNEPEPEILAIDHDIKYENIDESWFNSFSPKDFTDLNRAAKEAVRKRGVSDYIIQRARDDGNQMIQIIKLLAENAGWTVKVEASQPEQILN